MHHSLITDVAASLLLTALVVLFAASIVDFSIRPHEDAAILMRYAKNFAGGHGIVWNVGDKPVDGATDFLFMVVVGLLVRAGLSLEFATRSIGLVSHILTVVIVYWALRKRFQAGPVASLVSALYVAVGPGLFYVAAYFGIPFFSLLASLTWYFALRLIQQGETHRSSMLFALSALTTALIRPEGVILSGLMLMAVIYLRGLRSSLLTVSYFLGMFTLIGGAYFLWRWQYFGHPLPNPFYKKGGGHIYPNSLMISFKNVIMLCCPFLLPFVFGLYSRKTLRMTIGFSIPVVGFALAFILLSNEMNFAARFQYAVLPIVLMSWFPLLEGVRNDLRFPSWRELSMQARVTLIAGIAAVSLAALGYQGVVTYQNTVGRVSYGNDGRYDVALILREYGNKNYIIATTEAGLLPLYSGWRAIDTWGLNDEWIARNGGITRQYLDRSKPQMIVFHAFFSPLIRPRGTGEWFSMVMVLKTYAEANGYILAAAFGVSPYETHSYYVRADFPESRDIVSRIRAVDYLWARQKAVNYALLGPRKD